MRGRWMRGEFCEEEESTERDDGGGYSGEERGGGQGGEVCRGMIWGERNIRG